MLVNLLITVSALALADRPPSGKGQVQAAFAIAAILNAQRGHLFVWVPVLFGIGIGIYFQIRFEPSFAKLVLIGVSCAAGGLAAAVIQSAVRYCLLIPVFIGFGFCWAAIQAHTVAEPVLSWRYYGPVEGRVIKIDRSASEKPRLTLDQVFLSRVDPAKTPKIIRVSLHGDQRWIDPKPGQIVMMTAHLSPPQGPVEPGGFDFRRMAWFQQLGAVGYTRTPALVLEPAQAGNGLWLYSFRKRLADYVSDTVGGETGAFAAAITTGDRADIPLDVLEHLRASNLAHLLAISGLHMGLLVGFVFSMTRWGLACLPTLAMRIPAKGIAAAIALVSGAMYLGLSGASIATQRAFIMVSVMLVAVMLHRRALTLRAVAMAAMIVLLIDPIAVLGPGFQMSFAATTALVAVFGALRHVDLPKLPWWSRGITAVLTSSLVAGLATAPFAAAHFNIVSHYGLAANLLSVPIMGLVVMPAAVMAAILSPMQLDWLALWVMGQGIDWILWVAEQTATTPGAVGRIKSPDPLVLPLLALGGTFVVAWRHASRWVGVVICIVGFGIWGQSKRPDILIADTGGLIGVMSDNGRVLSREKGSGFIADNWLENDGDMADQKTAFDRGTSAGGNLYSAQFGAHELIHAAGKRAAQALTTCEKSQIVIANQDMPNNMPCRVFDIETLRDTGSVAGFQTDTGIKWVTSRDLSGHRLWNTQKNRAD